MKGQGAPGGAARESVTLEFCDLEHEVFGVIRLGRSTAHDHTSVHAVVCLGRDTVARVAADDLEAGFDSFDSAEAAGVKLQTVEPLEHWSAELATGDVSLRVEARALGGSMKEVERREQLCLVSGAIQAAGVRREVAGAGRRIHARNLVAPHGRRRSLFVVAGEEGFTVEAVRPAGAEGHDAELRSALFTTADGSTLVYEDVRLSTVYDADGEPRTAGVELWAPGEDYPRRLSGAAVLATSIEGDEPLRESFLRWSVDGAPGQGGYLHSPA